MRAATEWVQWSSCTPKCVRRPNIKRYRERRRYGCTIQDKKYCNIMHQALILTEHREKCDNLVPCKVNGQWSGWSEWTKCSFFCGNQGVKMRNRECYYNISLDFRLNANANRCKVFITWISIKKMHILYKKILPVITRLE